MMRSVRLRIGLGAVLVVLICSLYAFLALNGISYQHSITKTPLANLTVIAEGSVPTADLGLLALPSPTPTYDPNNQEHKGIQPGAYVQITGTGGAGLNIRSASGLESKGNFLGAESQVFFVIGGPEEKDGYTWWQLSVPYDKNQQGWAAENYLSVILQ